MTNWTFKTKVIIAAIATIVILLVASQLDTLPRESTSAPIGVSNPNKVDTTERDARRAQNDTRALMQEQLEQCKRYILDYKDFPGNQSKWCKGIEEDDTRLIPTYDSLEINGLDHTCMIIYQMSQSPELYPDVLISDIWGSYDECVNQGYMP